MYIQRRALLGAAETTVATRRRGRATRRPCLSPPTAHTRRATTSSFSPLLPSPARPPDSAPMVAALNDVTTGSSTGCVFGDGAGGWPALAGWDAVTGFGTPNFGAMAAVTDALP